ncbi:MAG: hypothetical protein ACQETQ_13390 [Spirochaetota bacterium]
MSVLNTRRTLVLTAAVFLLTISPVTAQDFRNIASFEADAYFDGEFETTLNEVFLANLTSLVTLETKIEQQTRSDNSSTFVFLGPIFTWTPNFYTISRYGIGYHTDNNFGHEFEIDANYESQELHVGGGIRARTYPDEDIWFIIPSLGGKIFPGERMGIRAKYFFSYNDQDQTSHALWSEADYAVTDVVTVKLGGSGEIGDDPIDPDTAKISYTVLTGASFKASDTVNLRYHLEYLGRVGENYDDGIRNLILVDWRF